MRKNQILASLAGIALIGGLAACSASAPVVHVIQTVTAKPTPTVTITAKPTPTVTATKTVAPPAPKVIYVAPAAPAYSGLSYAGQSAYGSVYVNSVTSAPFGILVADAYSGGGGSDYEVVYSPVTGQSYGMTYENVGNETIEATGGSGALVQFAG